MKVEELIKELLKFDPELEVMFIDFENGQQEVTEVKMDEERDWSKYPARVMKPYVKLE